MILYQFPISYYCEKVRWGLEYKRIDYQSVNVVPGLHRLAIKCNAPNCIPPITVPVLLDGDVSIQGSDFIMDYLDRSNGELLIGFEVPELVEKARVIEKFLDEEVGVPLRAVLYSALLDHRQKLIAVWNYHGSWCSRIYLQMATPGLKLMIKRMYKTDKDSIVEYKKLFSDSLDRLDRLYSNRAFLVGDRFSRVDMSFAAFLAPLAFPAEHPFPWPVNMPNSYTEFCQEHMNRLCMKRVTELYRDYRHNGASARYQRTIATTTEKLVS